MRILALDVGTKTIGVAASDPTGSLATPITVIRRARAKEDIRQVIDLAKRYEAERIVIGLPISMSGAPSEQTRLVEAFVRELRVATPLPIETFDERLTTVEAERRMREAGLSARKRRANIDAMAAMVLLQGYLDAGGVARSPAPPPEPIQPARGRRRPTSQR
ncbi:MAG: Holliday junction resolvase RuvX [Chloroflexi bacterium]|nr:Holliday junction resolvase RuvX [Chloroflexota bacterium]